MVKEFFSKIGVVAETISEAQGVYRIYSPNKTQLGRVVVQSNQTAEFVSELWEESLIFNMEDVDRIKQVFKSLIDLAEAEVSLLKVKAFQGHLRAHVKIGDETLKLKVGDVLPLESIILVGIDTDPFTDITIKSAFWKYTRTISTESGH